MYSRTAKTLGLHCAGTHNPLAHGTARLRRLGRGELFARHGRNLHVQVYTVHQRARDASHITAHGRWSTGTLLVGVVIVAARAGVHRGYEREVRRVINRVAHPRDGYMFILHRLAQHLQHRVSKLGHLVEEQHAIVCQRHLTRLGRVTTANERHRRGHMVRGTERPLAHKAARSAKLTRYGVYLGCFERLVQGHRGHNGRHTAREHSLSRAWRAYHYHVMSSRRGNL